MKRTLRSLAGLAATLALIVLGAAGCAKKLTVDELAALSGPYPEGRRDSLERTPSDLVVWPDVPNQVTNIFDGDTTTYLTYRTGAGSIQAVIFDYRESGGYQLYRRESGGGYRRFTDFVLTPYQRWSSREYYSAAQGTVVLPPAQFFTFADASPAPVLLKGYVGRAVTSGISSSSSQLTNLGETADGSSVPGIAYTGQVQTPDSLINLSWATVPGAAGYWVHVYQTRNDIRIGEEAIAIGLASPVAIGKVRDLFVAYIPAPQTSYKIGDALPPASRVLVYRPLAALVPVLVRVSAVDANGRMIATTGLSGDLASFREVVGVLDRLRTFPLGAVVVTPDRPPPPDLATAPASRVTPEIESGVPGLTYIRSGSASLLPDLALTRRSPVRRVVALALVGITVAASVAAPQARPGAREFTIARLKYGGGGDWYEDRTSLVNLLRGVRERTSIPVGGDQEVVVEPGAAALFQYPFVFACGHGNMKFTPTEVANLRRYLVSGGFLWVDDDFGIEPSFRREMKKVFPDARIVELPFSHPIFHGLYDFPHGLPKVHEHDGGPARAFGIVHDGRLVVFFSYDCDLGDGLEDEDVHHDPPEKRDAALRMGLNIVHYALTH